MKAKATKNNKNNCKVSCRTCLKDPSAPCEPLYNILIKKAVDYHKKDTRITVIEAISALEVCFSITIKKRLIELFKSGSRIKQKKFHSLLEFILNRPSFEDYKRLSRFMLRHKIDENSLKRLDITLKIRNEVVHNGKSPSKDETEEVLGTVSLLLLHLIFEQWPRLKEQKKGVCPIVNIVEDSQRLLKK